MKKVLWVLLFLSCLSTILLSQEISEKEGKKVIEDIRRYLNESLEEKVFRSKNTIETRTASGEVAFETGKERMAFLKMEEKEIMEFEEILGMEANENRVFLSQKFDEIHKEFNFNKNEIESISIENKKLNEYLSKLNNIEQKIRTGN